MDASEAIARARKRASDWLRRKIERQLRRRLKPHKPQQRGGGNA